MTYYHRLVGMAKGLQGEGMGAREAAERIPAG